MKYVRKIAVVTLSLIMAMLPMIVTPVAMAEDDFNASDWVMVQPGEVIYKDAHLEQALTETTDYKLVKLAAVQDDVAAVRAGGKTVFISLQYVSHLHEGDELVANCKTKIYEEPSTKSRSQTVLADDKVEFVSISDDCVKVRYYGEEGYMYIKHLDFKSNSRRFTMAIPTSLN